MQGERERGIVQRKRGYEEKIGLGRDRVRGERMESFDKGRERDTGKNE